MKKVLCYMALLLIFTVLSTVGAIDTLVHHSGSLNAVAVGLVVLSSLATIVFYVLLVRATIHAGSKGKGVGPTKRTKWRWGEK